MLTGSERPARRASGDEEQLALDLGVTERAPARDDAWWVAAVEAETEGDQDTGWWDA